MLLAQRRHGHAAMPASQMRPVFLGVLAITGLVLRVPWRGKAHRGGGATSRGLDRLEQGSPWRGLAMASAVVQCTGMGVPEPKWLGFIVLRPLKVCVFMRCLVTAKGVAFGPPKRGEHGGGHGGRA